MFSENVSLLAQPLLQSRVNAQTHLFYAKTSTHLHAFPAPCNMLIMSAKYVGWLVAEVSLSLVRCMGTCHKKRHHASQPLQAALRYAHGRAPPIANWQPVCNPDTQACKQFLRLSSSALQMIAVRPHVRPVRNTLKRPQALAEQPA